MTSAKQKEMGDKLIYQKEAEDLYAKGIIVPKPPTRKLPSEVYVAFQKASEEGNKARLPDHICQSMGYLASFEEQYKSVENTDVSWQIVDGINGSIRRDYDDGKLSSKNQKKIIEYVNQVTEDYFGGLKKFEINDVNFREDKKFPGLKGGVDWIVLTLTESGNYDTLTREEWRKVMRTIGFSVLYEVKQVMNRNDYSHLYENRMRNRYKGRDRLETDVILNEVNFRTTEHDFSRIEFDYELALGSIYLEEARDILSFYNVNKHTWSEVLKIDDIYEPVYNIYFNMIAFYSGIENPVVAKELTLGFRNLYLKLSKSGNSTDVVQKVKVGISVICLVTMDGMFYELKQLRTSDGINKALETDEHTKLYLSLFPNELISRETFEQAINDNIDFHYCTYDFKYEDDFAYAPTKILAKEPISKKHEMEGRVLLAKGKLNEASEFFEKALKNLPERYEYVFHSQTVAYGTELFIKLAEEYENISNFDLALYNYLKALEFINYDKCKSGESFEIDDYRSELNHDINRMQKYNIDSQLHAANTNLNEEIERRKAAEQANQNIVRQYAHTLGNTLFPETIYSIAKSLKGHGEFRKESLILRQAYHAEILVRHQAELLRVQHGAGDNFDEFQRLIYQDRLPEDRPDEAVTVRDILNYATERVVARLLNQNDSKLEKAREQLVSKSGMELDALRNSFEEQVFFESQQTALEWVNENVGRTKIGKLSPLWKKVRLRKDGYAHALLQGDHWGELLLNSFKYADHTNKEFLTLRFEEHEAENRTWLRMIWENPFLKDEKIESAEVSEKPEDYGKVQKNTVRNFGEGLKGIEANLRQLSATEDENLLLKYGLKNGKFIVTLNYRSDMLVPYQIKNPDLVKNYFQRKREAKEKT